jgi:drug/metabolite transporter (DMT)-like permease
MLAALLTTAFFATTAVFARRAALVLGSTAANFWRLLLAAVLLGAWTLLFGHGFGVAFGWFFVSGLVGFGLGGLLMFHALPRAGANLANLTVQCGSAVVALVVEWTWLGTSLSGERLVCIAVILGGVILGLAPRSFPQFSARQLAIGAGFAVLSAVGQGVGQVLSRKAFKAAGGLSQVDPGTATFERALAGLLIAAAALLVVWVITRFGTANGRPVENRQAKIENARAAAPWVLLNTLTGPVLGVSCLQWALSQAHAGLVQSIVATAPLLTAPLAWKLGEDLPRARYFAGAVLAIAGTVALWWVK